MLTAFLSVGELRSFTTGEAATLVLGQSSFIAGNKSGASATTLYEPSDVFVAGTKLIVVDYMNNRVLIWNQIPTANAASADVVIGQKTMTNNQANQGGLSASSLSGPRSAWVAGSKLFVSDGGNNRVLIFNTIPTSNNASADVVVGQPNFTSGSSALGAAGLNQPRRILVVGTKMLIADMGNNRVLIYKVLPAL
jgi:hypothetical protein